MKHEERNGCHGRFEREMPPKSVECRGPRQRLFIRKSYEVMKLIMSNRPLDVSFIDDPQVKYIDLSSLKIAHCVGCFGCWTKTPGRCVIRDDATKVYPCIAESDTLLYVSHIRYGGYDTGIQ